MNQRHDGSYRHALCEDLGEIICDRQPAVERFKAVFIWCDADLHFDLLTARILYIDSDHDLTDERMVVPLAYIKTFKVFLVITIVLV